MILSYILLLLVFSKIHSIPCSNISAYSQEFLYNEHCYIFSPQQQDWNASVEYCRNWYKEASLISIHNLTENQILSQKISDFGPANRCWIGLLKDTTVTIVGNHSRYSWLDGSPFDYEGDYDENEYVRCFSLRDTGIWGDDPCTVQTRVAGCKFKFPVCFNKEYQNSCSNHGTCLYDGVCSCTGPYHGAECQYHGGVTATIVVFSILLPFLLVLLVVAIVILFFLRNMITNISTGNRGDNTKLIDKEMGDMLANDNQSSAQLRKKEPSRVLKIASVYEEKSKKMNKRISVEIRKERAERKKKVEALKMTDKPLNLKNSPVNRLKKRSKKAESVPAQMMKKFTNKLKTGNKKVKEKKPMVKPVVKEKKKNITSKTPILKKSNKTKAKTEAPVSELKEEKNDETKEPKEPKEPKLEKIKTRMSEMKSKIKDIFQDIKDRTKKEKEDEPEDDKKVETFQDLEPKEKFVAAKSRRVDDETSAQTEEKSDTHFEEPEKITVVKPPKNPASPSKKKKFDLKGKIKGLMGKKKKPITEEIPIDLTPTIIDLKKRRLVKSMPPKNLTEFQDKIPDEEEGEKDDQENGTLDNEISCYDDADTAHNPASFKVEVKVDHRTEIVSFDLRKKKLVRSSDNPAVFHKIEDDKEEDDKKEVDDDDIDF